MVFYLSDDATPDELLGIIEEQRQLRDECLATPPPRGPGWLRRLWDSRWMFYR